MVLRTFSPARAWRPAVVARLARTLGFRNTQVRCSSRKCACRRELNSHDEGKAADFSAQRRAVASNGQSRRKSKQPDFKQSRRERRPVQTHEEAARGGNWKQHPTSILRGYDRRVERSSHFKARTLGACMPSKLGVKVLVVAAKRKKPCKYCSGGCRRGVPRLLLS